MVGKRGPIPRGSAPLLARPRPVRGANCTRAQLRLNAATRSWLPNRWRRVVDRAAIGHRGWLSSGLASVSIEFKKGCVCMTQVIVQRWRGAALLALAFAAAFALVAASTLRAEASATSGAGSAASAGTDVRAPHTELPELPEFPGFRRSRRFDGLLCFVFGCEPPPPPPPAASASASASASARAARPGRFARAGCRRRRHGRSSRGSGR